MRSSRPPAVSLVARTHWVVGAAVTFAIGLMHLMTRAAPIAFSPKSYAIAGTLAGLFLLTGTLVWFGLAPGRPLSRLCALFYLIRPGMCFSLWDAMSQPEFKAHFSRTRETTTPAQPSGDRPPR